MHARARVCMHTHSHAEREREISNSLYAGKKLQESDAVGGTSLLHCNTMQFTNELGLWKGKIKTDSSLHIKRVLPVLTFTAVCNYKYI